MKDRIKKQHTGNLRKEYSRTRETGFLLMGTILLLAGCVKDDLYNTQHPDKGVLVVTADWAGASSEAVLPDTYILHVDNQEHEAGSTPCIFPSLLSPGQHKLLACSKAEGITTDKATATVNTLEDGTLEPLPGYLFSAVKEVEITADDTLRTSMSMRQHNRLLSLVIKMEEGEKERLSSVSATLEGIASSVDLGTGTLTDSRGKAVIPLFRDGTEEGAPVLKADLRLLGVIPAERQVLTLILELKSGDRQTITNDLTEYLEGFSDGEKEPLLLYTSLELPAEAGVGAVIKGWEVVDGGDIDIH